MTERPRPLRSEEDVNAHLEKVLDDMERLGRASSKIARKTGLVEGERRPARSYREELLQSMKAHLADELPVARPLHEGTEIDEAEYQREIAKQALANLKLPTLRDIARDAGLRTSGNQADLLARLVTHFGSDLEQVTDVLIRYQMEPTEGRRHATWLYPVSGAPDANRVASIMRKFVHRYLRTDLAQWFVFESVRRRRDVVTISGSLRNYRVTLGSQALPDDRESAPQLTTKREDYPVNLAIKGDQQILRATARARRESDASATAFTYVTDAERVDALYHLHDMPRWDVAGQWRPHTIWLLASLRSLLVKGKELRLEVVTSALFERSTVLEAHPSADAPQVRTLRLHGRHVLDSPVACHNLARGEQLTAVTFLADAWNPDRTYIGQFPIRLSIQGDEVGVMTGFGQQGPGAAREIQNRLVDQIANALTQFQLTKRATLKLLERIEARADDPEPPESADLFGRARAGEIELVETSS